MSRLHVWWTFNRRCACTHIRSVHTHYRARNNPLRMECSMCAPGVCERFQWRLFKWVY